MTEFPGDYPDRADIAAQTRSRLAWMEQGRTSERMLFVLETGDQTVIYAAESRAISGPDENPEPEPEADEHQAREYVTEVSVPSFDDGRQALYSPGLSDPEPGS